MKKTKILLSSILTIMLCVSLITGATFALFTSEDHVNIAITSGKVDVVATVNESSLEMKSTLPGSDGEFNALGAAEFVDGKNLSITNMVPGDYVTFDLEIANNSTVNVKWQFAVSGDTESANGFLKLLNVEFSKQDGDPIALVKTSQAQLSAWNNAEVGAPIEAVKVKISMPESVTKEQVEPYEGDQSLILAVTAVQGNADTTDPDPTAYNISVKADVEELEASGEPIAQNINLLQDIDLGETEWSPITLAADAEFIGNGHTITLKSEDIEAPLNIVEEENNNVKNVTMRYEADFGRRATWDEEGTKTEAYQVNNDNGLTTFANNVNGIATISGYSMVMPISASAKNYSGKTIELTQDIDLGGKEWTPIGKRTTNVMSMWYEFDGHFNGNGYTISNLTITDNNPTVNNGTERYYYLGLFGHVVDATIENVNINGVKISGYKGLGGIAGWAQNSTIKNCDIKNTTITVDRTIANAKTDKLNVSAFVGELSNTNVTDCTGNAAIELRTSNGTIKNVQVNPDTASITSFEIDSVEGLYNAYKMIAANEFGLGVPNGQITMNFVADEYDFAEAEYTPISLNGFIVDGNGAVIKNLNKSNDKGWAGLFGSVENCTVKNFVFENANLEGCDVGVVAGKAINSNLENITVKGDVNLTWVAKVGMDYEVSGIGVLTGYWKDNSKAFVPSASLECNANMSFGKVSYTLDISPSSAKWATDESNFYFGTIPASVETAPQATEIVTGDGYSLNKIGDPRQKVTVLAIGETITFGSYPQTRVTESKILSQLSSHEHEAEWTADDNTNVKYTDVTLDNGEKYRGVYINTVEGGKAVNGYNRGEYYWFHYEPITWHVIETPERRAYNETYTLLADCILDSRVRFIEDQSHAADNTLMTWLKDEFYNTVFGDVDQRQTNLIISKDDTSSEVGKTGIQTKVTLLTEAQRKAISWTDDNILTASDYARCRGLYEDNGMAAWWLRYKGNDSSIIAHGQSSQTDMRVGQFKDFNAGVVPVIYMDYTIDFLSLD